MFLREIKICSSQNNTRVSSNRRRLIVTDVRQVCGRESTKTSRPLQSRIAVNHVNHTDLLLLVRCIESRTVNLKEKISLSNDDQMHWHIFIRNPDQYMIEFADDYRDFPYLWKKRLYT